MTRWSCSPKASTKEARSHVARLDSTWSRKKLDVCLLSDQGEQLDQLAVPPDVDSLRALARRIDELHAEPVCAVVESMTGARIVHDTLEQQGWDVEIADAQKVKGLAPLACKQTRSTRWCWRCCRSATWCPRSGCPILTSARRASWPRFRLHLVKHRSMLKHRIHSTLINFGEPCTVSDLFGVAGRRLLEGSRCPSRGART